MIEIVFVACLLTAPEQCEERTLPAFTDVTEIQCTMGGHAMLAAWNRAHPHLRLEQWRCRSVDGSERDA